MLSLESLTIDWCHELEHIVVDGGDCSGGNELDINVFPKLKELNVYDCKKLKYIFGRINDNDQNNNEIQLHLPMINLGLQNITLKNLPMMIYLFVGPKNAFAVENLKSIVIFQCEKLEIVFSTSVLRCLSQLSRLRIHECNELKHIIEDDIENAAMSSKTCFPVLKSLIVVKCNKLKIVFSTAVLRCLSQLSHLTIRECNELKHIIEDDDHIENQRMPNTCFPMLETLAVVKCNKLKSVFSISMKKEFPELKVMLITDAYELEEIFKSVGDVDQKVEIPNLKVVAFLNLPSLCHDQGIQFQAVENRFVKNCKKLSLTSLRSSMDIDQYMRDLRPGIGIDAYYDLLRLFYQLLQIPADLCNENPQKEMNRTPETEHEFSENVSDLEIQSVTTSPKNSKELMSEKSMTHSLEEIDTTIKLSQELLNEQSKSQQHPLGEIDNVVPPSQVIEISVEEGTTSTNDKTITSTHLQLEDEDSKKCIPSCSIVNTKLPATKDVDIGDSQETITMEDINKLIEEDPLLAFEKLLTGVRSFSIGTLLQELKTLMDSSSDPDHLVSNQESKSKLISFFHGLNQHQGILPSDVKEFVEKVQNFFNDNIIKHDTAQEVLKKHNQLLDSKTDLMNKLSSAKSTQLHIDSETSTANAKIHELSLQIEDLENQRNGLKSLVNKCDVQKMKLKVECTEWAQQSQELISALASSEVNVREVERARNLAKEDFANLKSSFPTF